MLISFWEGHGVREASACELTVNMGLPHVRDLVDKLVGQLLVLLLGLLRRRNSSAEREESQILTQILVGKQRSGDWVRVGREAERCSGE